MYIRAFLGRRRPFVVWSSSLLLFSPWIELRGQLVQKLLFFLEADFGEIGWL
jgi:hypothetical protein